MAQQKNKEREREIIITPLSDGPSRKPREALRYSKYRYHCYYHIKFESSQSQNESSVVINHFTKICLPAFFHHPPSPKQKINRTLLAS
jgi:hypothetical protein